jgi:hypothetical protein
VIECRSKIGHAQLAGNHVMCRALFLVPNLPA